MIVRQTYRKDRDLEEFREKLKHYLNYGNDYKTMSGLCEYLGIERYTLSRYKKRGGEWKEIIRQARFFIIHIQPQAFGLRFNDWYYEY